MTDTPKTQEQLEADEKKQQYIDALVAKLQWDANGLMPAVVQDMDTGLVLMVAWMNAEALRLTLDKGQTHFWSRSRQELWHKGATSGNIQYVAGIYVDCDADTILIKAIPAGPACHTGQDTCFYRPLEELLDE